jgi:hypothetical protein
MARRIDLWPDSNTAKQLALVWDTVVASGGLLRHPVSDHDEICLWLGTDGDSGHVEIRRYSQEPSGRFGDTNECQLVGNGVRIPVHLATLIGAQLQGLGLWAKQEAVRNRSR